MGLARGPEGPWCLHLDLKVLITEVDPKWSRAPQTALLKMGCGLSAAPHITKHRSEEGPFLRTEGVGWGRGAGQSHVLSCSESWKNAPT